MHKWIRLPPLRWLFPAHVAIKTTEQVAIPITAQMATPIQKTLTSNVSGTPKRQRSANNSPTDQANKPKKQRTLANILSDDLKMQIINDPNGIDIDQLQTIETKLMEELDIYLATDPTSAPTYTSSFRNGILKMFCSDTFSVEWLKKVIDNMSPLWEGANIKCEPMYGNSTNDIDHRNPRRNGNINRIKRQTAPRRPTIRFFVPNGVKQPTFETVVKKLQLQNRPLDTSGWIAWRAEEKEDGMFYHVSVEESDIEVIRTKSSRLFYCFTKLKINLPKVPNGEGTNAGNEIEMAQA